MPQLRGGPAPRQDFEQPAYHDPGLMAAFQRGIGLAEAQQSLEADVPDPAPPRPCGPSRSPARPGRPPGVGPRPAGRRPRCRGRHRPGWGPGTGPAGTPPRRQPAYDRRTRPAYRRRATRPPPRRPRGTARVTGRTCPVPTDPPPGTTGAHQPDEHGHPHPQRSRRPSYPKESIHHGERCADRPGIRSRLADERPRPARTAHHERGAALLRRTGEVGPRPRPGQRRPHGRPGLRPVLPRPQRRLSGSATAGTCGRSSSNSTRRCCSSPPRARARVSRCSCGREADAAVLGYEMSMLVKSVRPYLMTAPRQHAVEPSVMGP